MSPVVYSNEAMRREYISTILHTAVSILNDLVITPQANIIGEENTGRVDYAIKRIISEMLEEIICITEGKQNQSTIEFKVNGIRKHTSVHILFARTFIPNQSQVTPKENAECRVFPNPSRGRENVQHAVRLGLCSNNPIKRAVKQIFDDGSIQEFPSIAEAQRVTGIDKVNIGRVYRGIRNHAGGFR
ncbi:hypothetical protein RhiirA1_533652 [Rhizophagus irregularis]|uniref:DNA endonuclease I-HmuI-like NUMOD-like domain-containing protein n=1 Tax=Rhizophagus irregularis TaxID=588596 RepID=A0A2N0S0S9_9GLOM|nr:hypothetical protein RhiirA1_533652 [Rhizophagus irregularis]